MEAFNLFKRMRSEVNRDIVSFLCHAQLPIQEEAPNLKEGRQQKTDMSKMTANKEQIERQEVIMVQMKMIISILPEMWQ